MILVTAKAAELGEIFGEPRVVRFLSSSGFLSLLSGASAQGENPWIQFAQSLLTPRLLLLWQP